MSTQTAPRGRGVSYLALRHELPEEVGEPSTYGVLDEGPARAIRFYTNALAETETLDPDEVLGVPSANQRDITDFQHGLPTVAGDLTLPVCVNEFGDVLTMLFGLPTSAADGGGGYYIHTWASGADILPTAHIEQERRPGERQVGKGIVFNSLRLMAEKASGQLQATVGLMGRSMSPPVTAASVFESILRRDYRPIAKRQAEMKIDNATIAAILSCSIDWTNNITPAPYLDGSEYAAGMIAGDSRSSGSVRARYTNGELAALGLARSDHNVKIKWYRDANNWLEMENPRVRFQKVGTPVSGPGFEDIDYGFVAAQNSGAAACTFRLRNQIATYVMPAATP